MPKILLIRFSSIGDIVLCSPIIRALKQQLSAEIHFLTKKNFAQLLSPNPYLSKVHVLEGSLAATKSALQHEQFDFVVDLHKNLRSKRITSALKIPVYSFDKLNWEKWLMVNFKTNRLGDQHLVDRYFAGVSGLGVKNDGQGLDFFLDKQSEFSADEVLRFSEGKQTMALVLGAAHATKQMPLELLQQIIIECTQPIVLLGGPQEVELANQLMESQPKEVINLCGKTKISESAAIIEKCAAVITPDTGMMHIAAALKVPIVAVWGNTIPEFGMYPYFPTEQEKYINIEQKGLSCRPCSKIGKKKCPKGHFNCMRCHSAATILAAVYKLTH